MFLVSIMLSIAGVFFSKTLASSKLDAAAREISATIRQAKSMAVTKGERQTVTINIDAKQYGIEGRGSKGLPGDVRVMAIDPFSGISVSSVHSSTQFPFSSVGPL